MYGNDKQNKFNLPFCKSSLKDGTYKSSRQSSGKSRQSASERIELENPL